MNNWPGKSRPRFRPLGRHGRIKRIVNSGVPMMSYGDAQRQQDQVEFRTHFFLLDKAGHEDPHQIEVEA